MAGLGIVSRLPDPLRSLVIRSADDVRSVWLRRSAEGPLVRRSLRRLARLPARTGRRYVGRRVVVAGVFGSRCGLQRGAELMVLDLRARGAEVLAFDFTAALGIVPNMEAPATADMAQVAAWQPTDLVIHLNPPLFARVLALFPPALVTGCTVVGYWVWELNIAPPAWRAHAAFVDEIWAPSPFAAAAVSAGLPDFTGPVRAVAHNVDLDPFRATPAAGRADLRARFGLPQDCFVAGFSFSFDSSYARKNPGAVIEAFRLAFRAGQAVRLVVRCTDTRRFAVLFAHLASLAGDDPRILIWDHAETACPIGQFYGLIDLYISLHRSEGYGLTLAEAAQAGLPVLATGWGLAPDIANRPQLRTIGSRLVVPLDSQGPYGAVSGAVWAEPDLGEASSALQDAYALWAANRPTNPP